MDQIGSISAARKRLLEYGLRPSRIVRAEALSRKLGRSVRLKLECELPTGSFKIRPAVNGILSRLEEARRFGVIASSSGNFAQAVAYVARSLGITAEIVMMKRTLPFKVQATRALGAGIVFCENTFEDRRETTLRRQRETASVLLEPYDSEETIAADATVGLECLEQIEGPFCALVPVSGGGLLAGIGLALATEAGARDCRAFGAQPAINASMLRSLQAGCPVDVGPVTSVADALVASKPGKLTFELARKHVAGIALTGEKSILEAMRLLETEEGIRAEPAGAIAIAALLEGFACDAPEIVCVVSGCNRGPD